MSRRRPSRTGQFPASLEPLERRSLMSATVDLTIADAGFSDAANQPPPVPGARFYIQPTLQENGQAPTRPLPFSIYLSPTPTLTDQSVRIISRPNGEFGTWQGFTWTARATGDLPAGVTPGTWYPIVVVDPDNTIPESDESNNTLVAGPVTVVLPHDDLVAPTSSAPAAWPAGMSMNVFNSTSSGDERLYPVTIAYSLSVDNVAGNSDDIPLSSFTSYPNGSWHPGGPASSYSLDPNGYSVPLPADLPPGQYHLVTTIDPDNAIAEPDETNDSTFGPLITILPTGTVDYKAVEHPAVSGTAAAAPGSQIAVGAYAYSVFGQQAHPPMSFILSTDDIVGNADDILLGSYNAYVKTPTPPGMIVDYFSTPTLDVTVPTTLAPGHYKLFAVVDPDNQTPEFDESNNISPATDFTIVSPDTIDMTVQKPQIERVPFAAPGSQISVGTYPVSQFGQSVRPKVAFVLSSDETYGNGDDILLGSYNVNALMPPKPGLSACYAPPPTFDVTLPDNLAQGQYQLFAVVDPDNAILESNESNNVSLSTELTILHPPLISVMPLPDPSTPTVPLFTGTIFTPPSPTPPVTSGPSPSQPNQAPLAASPTFFRNVTPHSTLRTPITLTNPTGHRRTGTYKITLYLSTDDRLSRNDRPFSTQTLTATLRPHQTKTRRLTYKLPPSAKPGHRYVFATVTPIRTTRITPSAPPPTPLNLLTKSLHHPRPISKQLLDSNRPHP